MTNTLDSLRNNLTGVAETIAEYARQIRSGDYRDGLLGITGLHEWLANHR